jgi:hypothetical protein
VPVWIIVVLLLPSLITTRGFENILARAQILLLTLLPLLLIITHSIKSIIINVYLNKKYKFWVLIQNGSPHFAL